MPTTARHSVAFHVARHNPLLKLADGTSSWLIAVNGADAYVSPDWYVSPDQVPTWLYQTVHLTGTGAQICPTSELGPHLDALSAKFENWLAPKPPWTSSKMTAGRLDAMKKAIVGSGDDGRGGRRQLQAQPAQIRCRSRGCRDGACARKPNDAAHTIGQQMVALRPQLDYMSSTPASVSADGRNVS